MPPKPDQQLRQRIDALEATVEAITRLLSAVGITRADIERARQAVMQERRIG